MKKTITMTEELYQNIVRALTYYEDGENTAEESAEDFYDLLVEIQNLYEAGEEED